MMSDIFAVECVKCGDARTRFILRFVSAEKSTFMEISAQNFYIRRQPYKDYIA